MLRLHRIPLSPHSFFLMIYIGIDFAICSLSLIFPLRDKRVLLSSQSLILN